MEGKKKGGKRLGSARWGHGLQWLWIYLFVHLFSKYLLNNQVIWAIGVVQLLISVSTDPVIQDLKLLKAFQLFRVEGISQRGEWGWVSWKECRFWALRGQNQRPEGDSPGTSLYTPGSSSKSLKKNCVFSK